MTHREAKLIEKIRSLPPSRVAEVENFVDFLRQRERERQGMRTAAAKLSEKSFARVWDNPEDAEYDRL